MKKLLYSLNRLFGTLIPDILFVNLLFLFNCIRFKSEFYFLNYRNPRTFNEKVNRIKFFQRNKLSVIVADKLEVRKFVAERIGSQFLIPLLAVFNNPAEIDFKELPTNFIIKLNNGSGFNLINRESHKLDLEFTRKFFENAFNHDIYSLSREWHYKEIEPKILVEKLLEENITDYKFFCNKNGPFLIQVDSDRFQQHKRNFYNLNWEKQDIQFVYSNTQNIHELPSNLGLMIDLAKSLSQDFPFCRVDLYVLGDKIYFGEITLHPEGGVGPFKNIHQDFELGKSILI